MEYTNANNNTEAASVTAPGNLDANGKLNHVANVPPEFGDAKVAGRIFGFCRAHLHNLASEGKIRSACIRRPGAFRGRRLYDLASIRQFIEANIAAPVPVPSAPAAPAARQPIPNPLA